MVHCPDGRRPFVPFSTARLTIRAFRPDDAESLAAYRNDPDVARYQDWALPYRLDRARAAIEDDRHVGERPVAGEWWQLAIDLDGALIGDIASASTTFGAVATLGYTLAAEHHGARLRGGGRRRACSTACSPSGPAVHRIGRLGRPGEPAVDPPARGARASPRRASPASPS